MNESNITKVYLLDVPLESDYKNTLYFASKSAQQTYFQSCIVESYTDFTYQRKDKIIRIPDIYDNIYHCNYVMYQNSNYSNKWFYAFIDKMEYINDGRTDITIETDVIQTWLFDYTIKPSFVEREHVNDDTVGKNTVPESLETGEYVRQAKNSDTQTDYLNDIYYLQNYYIIVAMSDIRMIGARPAGAQEYNGVYSGLTYLAFESSLNVDRFITDIQDDITSDTIYAIFICPRGLMEIGGSDWVQRDGYRFAFVPYSNSFQDIGTARISKPQFLDADYVPRNKKLLTFPYTYLLVNNYAGSVKDYRFEFFNTAYCTFTVSGALSPGCAIKLYPNAYNLKDPDYPDLAVRNYLEGLDGAKLPTCSWLNDPYTNWLTQNGVNHTIGMVSSGASIAGGIALLAAAPFTGGSTLTIGGGMTIGGIMGVTNQVKEKYEHSLAPTTAKGGVNQGDLIFAERNTFGFYKMSIRKEYAQIIDKYFDMFGYQVNMVKVPNKNHRARWWYTKTIDVNIDGAIDNNDIQKIKNAYNNGITFWRNASEIENYNLSNGIVS